MFRVSTGSDCQHRLRGLGALARHANAEQKDAYSAVWVFESREVWEKLWGSPEAPRPPAEYPKEWAVWENDILAPFLVRHPDTTRFTSYEEL
jgi:hypothetical protein